MGREEEFVEQRLKKIAEMRKAGINPYPYKFDKSDSAAGLQVKFAKLKPEEKSGKSAKVAGRVMAVRDMGKIAFASILDESGKIQILLQEGETSEKNLDLFRKYVDSGDFIGVSGKVMRTKRGELSIIVETLEVLSKSIKPLPDKWHGLEDKEERYRKRYVDLIMSPEVRAVFDKREKIVESIREFLKAKGFHDIDTPYLQTVYGGASARPFETHLNALDINLFLSISPELYLKRLIVGGYEKVFTIARNFRNEGIDRWHNPEFTMMEVYQAYADYNDMMELTEDLFEYACKKVNNGSTKVKIKDTEIDFKKPWKRMTMLEAIKKFAGINADKMDASELKDFMEEKRVESKGNSWGMCVQSIFEHFCEEKLIQPTFITDHPLESTPLCKTHRSGDKRLIERFEPFCMGAELANAYSELNDPVLQRSLLEGQQEMLSSGDVEANPYDEDFVNAIEVGLPPTGGLGIGIDRMVILLTGSESIRDVIMFPFMKPEKLETKKENSVSKIEVKKESVKAEVSSAELKSMPSREDSLKLLKEYVKSESLQVHSLAVEASMRAYAKKYKENEEVWGTSGLLHDFDYEKYPEEHPIKGVEILRMKNYPNAVLQAILGHYSEKTKVARKTLLDKVLFAVDELSGFAVALAKVRADGFEGMSAESIEKALKKKDFAKGVSRDDVENGIKELGVDRKAHFELVISALKDSINLKKDSKSNKK